VRVETHVPHTIEIQTAVVEQPIVISVTTRSQRAPLCHPCKHLAECTKFAECKFVHPGQFCQHGHDICGGKQCVKMAKRVAKI
jgi:hypothetical protein